MSALTLSKLESHLWEAANILRGPVDAADFKTYVFPLLYFKRVSDVHDEKPRDNMKTTNVIPVNLSQPRLFSLSAGGVEFWAWQSHLKLLTSAVNE